MLSVRFGAAHFLVCSAFAVATTSTIGAPQMNSDFDFMKNPELSDPEGRASAMFSKQRKSGEHSERRIMVIKNGDPKQFGRDEVIVEAGMKALSDHLILLAKELNGCVERIEKSQAWRPGPQQESPVDLMTAISGKVKRWQSETSPSSPEWLEAVRRLIDMTMELEGNIERARERPESIKPLVVKYAQAANLVLDSRKPLGPNDPAQVWKKIKLVDMASASHEELCNACAMVVPEMEKVVDTWAYESNVKQGCKSPKYFIGRTSPTNAVPIPTDVPITFFAVDNDGKRVSESITMRATSGSPYITLKGSRSSKVTSCRQVPDKKVLHNGIYRKWPERRAKPGDRSNSQ